MHSLVNYLVNYHVLIGLGVRRDVSRSSRSLFAFIVDIQEFDSP